METPNRNLGILEIYETKIRYPSTLNSILTRARDRRPLRTGASTEKRVERPPHHVLSHLHLQALHRLHLKLGRVCLLYTVDLFKQLLDASLTLRARHLAVGHGFGHLAVLHNRSSVYVGTLRSRYQVLFDSLIDASPPFPLTRPKDIDPNLEAASGS